MVQWYYYCFAVSQQVWTRFHVRHKLWVVLWCVFQVTIYQPNDGKGFPVLDCPPAPPEDILICSYEDLPGILDEHVTLRSVSWFKISNYTWMFLFSSEKYWKKYQYASKFVQLVKSKTPKVTLYTKYAKVMLMENSPNADLEVCFYDGESEVY